MFHERHKKCSWKMKCPSDQDAASHLVRGQPRAPEDGRPPRPRKLLSVRQMGSRGRGQGVGRGMRRWGCHPAPARAEIAEELPENRRDRRVRRHDQFREQKMQKRQGELSKAGRWRKNSSRRSGRRIRPRLFLLLSSLGTKPKVNRTKRALHRSRSKRISGRRSRIFTECLSPEATCFWRFWRAVLYFRFTKTCRKWKGGATTCNKLKSTFRPFKILAIPRTSTKKYCRKPTSRVGFVAWRTENSHTTTSEFYRVTTSKRECLKLTQKFSDSVMAVSPFTSRLSPAEAALFWSDFMSEVKKHENVTVERGRNNNDEKIHVKYKMFVVFAVKPL